MTRIRLGWVLLALTLANLVNVMDRVLLSILAEPIKRDLRLSDTQLGLLAGLAFAVVYSVAAMPLARFADRGRARLVIGWSIAIWSLTTAVGGMARTFWQLAFMRLGVAGGEAGLAPASHALISKLFAPERRGFALGVFSLGIPLGGAAGAMLAGLLADTFGWRTAFFAVGPLGMALLPLVLLAIPKKLEPTPSATEQPIFAAARYLMTNPIYRELWLGAALITMYGFAFNAFFAPYFIRIHGLSAKQMGAAFGFITAVTGVIGILLGGMLHDWAARRKPGTGLYPAIAGAVLSALLGAVGWFCKSSMMAISLEAVSVLLYFFVISPTLAISQNLAPPEMRATSAALMGASMGLVGASLGPLVTGLVSDELFPWVGQKALAYGLASMSIFQLFGAGLYLRAARRVGAHARQE